MKAINESKFDEMGNYLPDLPAGAWAVYVAHFPSPYGLFVKVGISETPVTRVWGVHCNSPFPLERFVWSWVQSRVAAVAAERVMREVHAEARTRGEWFRFDLPGEEVDAMIQELLRPLESPGRRFNWKPGTLQDVLEHAQEKQKTKLDAFARKNAGRDKLRRLYARG